MLDLLNQLDVKNEGLFDPKEDNLLDKIICSENIDNNIQRLENFYLSNAIIYNYFEDNIATLSK